MLLTLAAFAVALGVLVVIHELGHYLVARACGVRILRFSVGFGKVLCKRTDRHGTEWALSAIPLGGYVKMLDEREGDVPPEQRSRAFNTQPVGKRIAIVAAGPVFNLALAALLYAALNMVGVKEPAAVLAAPPAGTPAAAAGVAAGDKILAIDGAEVATWGDARWMLLKSLTDRARPAIEVETAAGERRVRTVDFSGAVLGQMEGDVLGREGFGLASPRPVIRGVVPESAAAQAGLLAGDRIVAAGDKADPSATELIALIQGHAGRPLRLSVIRDGASLSIDVLPREERQADGKAIGRIGAQIGGDIQLITVRHGPLESLGMGVQRTAEVSWFSLRMLGKMVVGDVSLSNLSGPVTIADYAGQTARMGLEAYIAFLALVSVSLGVLNLLPIPMLDGGHLLYYLVEIIRGSPPPERWMEVGQRAGFGILMVLMAVALFNDFTRLLT
ncbi:RIP metalloprotease RseP [Pigmentiphaga sp. NML080357]|uniref:RIP metalloprotease RseP n=1 Tax=Pigmentiphaga sp. NML080357 TaxID=2008675 RepID=UPI000B40875F|nr:RIP metalloprotease RseP [Pigmentiphaga sp. NML080357]OVZ62173.1 RIP metalloprotease RseP [Pigmentiphaga sp. NML080357]